MNIIIKLFKSLTLHLKTINYNIVILLLGRIGVAVSGIISVKVSTNYLTPSQLGSLAQLISFYTFFYMLLIVPVSHYMSRGFLEWLDDATIKNNTIKFVLYTLIVSLFSGIFSGVTQYLFEIVNGFKVYDVAILTGVAVFVTGLNTFSTTSLNLINKTKAYVIFSNVSVWSSLLIATLLFMLLGTPFYWNLGQSFGLLIGSFSVVLIWNFITRKDRNTFTQTPNSSLTFTFNKIISFSWPIVLIAILWWIQSQSYRFTLEKVSAIANVGFFVVGYNLASAPLAMYETIMTQYLQPAFFEGVKNQDSKGQTLAWNSFAKIFLPGLVIIGVFTSASAPFLANILIGEKFRIVAVKVAQIAAVIETFRVAGGVMYHLGIAKMDNRMTIVPVAIGAILSSIGVYFFSKINPIYGTLGGLLLGGSVVLMISYTLSHRVLPITWPLRNITFSFILSLPLFIFFPLLNISKYFEGIFGSLFVLSIGAIYVLFVLIKFNIISTNN